MSESLDNVENNLVGSLVNVENNLVGSLVNVQSNLENSLVNVETNVLSKIKKLNLEVPVFANKTYVGKFQTGRLLTPIYVAYHFNKDGTSYNLNFSASYEETVFGTNYAAENVLLTKQNTPPDHNGVYYKAFNTPGTIFTGYQQTGINFVDNKMYWTPSCGPQLRTSKLDFETNLSIFYDEAIASNIIQQLELYPSIYFVDPLAFLENPYMVDSTDITEDDLHNQQTESNYNYNKN